MMAGGVTGSREGVRKLSPVQLDRAAGVLVGQAAGDALGAGYELAGEGPAQPAMIGGGLGGWAPGEWTDDTQQAVCVAEEAATGRIDPDAVGERLLAWYRSGPADVGAQTAAVLSRARTGAALPSLASAYLASHPRGGAGNGSLMRTGPVALAHLGDDAAIASVARAVSDLTHAHPLAGDACVLWSVAVDRAVRLGRLDGVRDGIALLPADRQARWWAWLDEAEQRPARSFRPNGFVVTALQAALAAISQTAVPSHLPGRHLAAALTAAVGIGGDTDTVAAIAGTLLGARWGASAIPATWLVALHGWPGYRCADLVRLAVLSAQGGQDDRTGWPSAPSLLAWYRERWSPRGTRVPLTDDPGVTVGDVAALAGVDASNTDVVVSLCRVGRDDVPGDVERVAIWLLDDASPAENPNLDLILADLGEQIAAWRDEGRRVFVHCVRAESRTPTVAAAYLAHRLGIPGDAALRRVLDALPSASPNPAFVAALRRIWPS